MAQSSDESRRKQAADREITDAKRRMKNDRNSGKPVKGKDVEALARAAEAKGRAEQELRMKRKK